MSQVDLHFHSCISDGRYTPAELIHKAVANGLTVISLTDHDNVDGLSEALAEAEKFPQLTIIPGIEISSDMPEGEVHILGYFIDYTNTELLSTLDDLRQSRQNRAKGMVDKLAELGLPVEWQRVQEIAGDGSIGRPHIARALLEKGHIATVKEAFDKYIAWGKPAYVERKKLSPAETVALILRAGGLPVLAHPIFINNLEALIKELNPVGLAGLEAYYGEFTPEQIRELAGLAKRYGLFCTGGSDYHGLDDNAETMLGGADVPLSVAEHLIAVAEKR